MDTMNYFFQGEQGMNATVKSVAEKSGVSIATVSRVINQPELVKAETCKRVHAAMKALNCEPSMLVRSSFRKKGNIVGVVLPDIENSFFTDVLRGISEVADENGISLFICNTNENEQKELRYLRLLKDANICGILATPVSDDDNSVSSEYLNLLNNINVPIVLIDRDVKYSNYPGVFIDNVHSAFNATRLLIESGHEKIAIITGPTNSKPGRERLIGYRDAFKFMNFPLDEELIYYGDFKQQSGYNCTKKILQEHPETTAIFVSNNLMTLGCLKLLNEKGMGIPEDMAVIGFDEQPLLQAMNMKLTVVDRPSVKMGEAAMNMMVEQLKSKNHSQIKRITLSSQLVIRGSEIYTERPDEKRKEIYREKAVTA
jgi:LacI family transcriptional regulator